VAGDVNDDVVIAATGLPALEVPVPQQGQVVEGGLLHGALALDVLRIDDEGHSIPLNDRANLKLASEVAATLAADPKELYDLAHFWELAHATSPKLLANYPAETRIESRVDARP
jgi:hypothetical protein